MKTRKLEDKAAPSPVESNWLRKDFCDDYLSPLELSTTEVHYGWLADGESRLALLPPLSNGSNVLDIGCGNGSNLIALSRTGARCFGIDVSPHMLDQAKALTTEVLGDSTSIALELQNMEYFVAFPEIKFDLIISIYSFECLASLSTFRAVLTTLYNRMRDGGVLIFAFSHPQQHLSHATLINSTSRSGLSLDTPIIYSFRDTVQILADSGFSIERVIEQTTRNPSRLSYESTLQFPYRFKEGRNPCEPRYDDLSNRAPHTVIYRVQKPPATHSSQPNASGHLEFSYGAVSLWGKNRSIRDRQTIGQGASAVELITLAPSDALVAVCQLLRFRVSSMDIENTASSGRNARDARPGRLLDLIDQELRKLGFQPSFRRMGIREVGQEREEICTFIDRVDPIFGEINTLFPTMNVGILVFVNGKEPASGTLSIERYIPVMGDTVEVLYVVSGWGSNWRPPKNGDQPELFPRQGDST